MAMRETVRSLRIYLSLSGVLGTFAYGSTIATGEVEGVGFALVLVGVALALSYIYLAVQLPVLLRTAPSRIATILKIGLGYLLFLIVLAAIGGAVANMGSGILGILITWYLLVNVRRLAREAREEAVVAPDVIVP
jgi:hypothetical protein